MKIHDFPLAPNPRKLRIYLKEKGIEVPFVLVNIIEGEQSSEAFLAKNPLGKTPVLELDDGTYLTESLPIIEYFEELHPDPPMWGTTPIERARARRIERIADVGLFVRVARWVHAEQSPLPNVAPDPAMAKAMREEMPTFLEVLDNELRGREFLAGDRVTVGDCTLFATIGFARFRELELEKGYDEITRWYEAFSKRPSTEVAFP